LYFDGNLEGGGLYRLPYISNEAAQPQAIVKRSCLYIYHLYFKKHHQSNCTLGYIYAFSQVLRHVFKYADTLLVPLALYIETYNDTRFGVLPVSYCPTMN